jgi:hypothetical protein
MYGRPRRVSGDQPRRTVGRRPPGPGASSSQVTTPTAGRARRGVPRRAAPPGGARRRSRDRRAGRDRQAVQRSRARRPGGTARGVLCSRPAAARAFTSRRPASPTPNSASKNPNTSTAGKAGPGGRLITNRNPSPGWVARGRRPFAPLRAHRSRPKDTQCARAARQCGCGCQNVRDADPGGGLGGA